MIQPIQRTPTAENYDIDKDQLYETKSGKTVGDIEFSEILRKELEKWG